MGHPKERPLSANVAGFESLAELALDMRSSWDHATDQVWRHLALRSVRRLAGTPGGYVYSAAVSAARPPGDYTARVMPHFDGVAIPLEDARILWQR
jgi:hypothetical protein